MSKPEWVKQFKKFLIDNDLTQKDVSEATGISQSDISGVINGHRTSRPTKESLINYMTDKERKK